MECSHGSPLRNVVFDFCCWFKPGSSVKKCSLCLFPPGYWLCHLKFTHVLIWYFNGLKYWVLISLQVGVCTSPPDWFQLYYKYINPSDTPKSCYLRHGSRDNHTHLLWNIVWVSGKDCCLRLLVRTVIRGVYWGIKSVSWYFTSVSISLPRGFHAVSWVFWDAHESILIGLISF